jgi:GntR family transcriptional regulator/MocR family aminotransferase
VLVRLAGEGSLHQQVYEGLRRAILDGRLSSGARLPSTRRLADDLGVSRNTALAAYEQLFAEGYVVGRVGAGTFVAAELPDTMLRAGPGGAAATQPAAPPALSAYGRRVGAADPLASPTPRAGGRPLRYDFRYGNPATADFPHEVWRRLLARRARRASPRSLGYGPPHGHAGLRAAVADYLRRSRAVVCQPDQIVVVNGSQQALDLVARVLLDPGDTVAIEEPAYQGARRVFVAAGARVVPVPVDADGADVAALGPEAASARVVYVTPSHQFPTGATMSLPRRLALLAFAASSGGYVVEDDYDSEYRYEGRPIEAVQGLDRSGRVIYVGTFSKVLFPSLRVGYLVLPPPLVAPLVGAKWLADRQTSTLEQEVLADFLAEGHFERHLRRARARNAARRETLLEALDAYLAGRVTVEGANAGVHLIAWLPDIHAADLPALVDRAAAAGVGLHPIAPYYVDPPARAGLLLGYGALAEREIREGVRLVAQVLDRPA